MSDGERVHINSAARFHCAPDWSWDTSGLEFSDRDLWVVLAGRGTLAWGADRYVLARGDVFVLDGSRRVRAGHRPDDPLTVVAVHFDGGGELPGHVRIAPIEFLAGVLERLLRCRLRGDAAAAERWLEVALSEVEEAEHAPPTTSDDLVATLADQIRERPGDDWRVSEIAGRAGISPQHLGRLFRERTGSSPKEYVLGARIEAARAYLRGSSLPIKRIARELGFHDEFHFSRSFRSRVGTSPAAYRSA
ncbi:MAG: helix-turn-helix domain-containing protein [Spirochaetota bacterium]